jgi:D-erythrulose 1-phosphate 3-epimerase
MIKNKIKLSVNTGFAVNRIIDNETFLRFVKNELKIKYIQPTSDWLNLFMPKKYSLKNVNRLSKLLRKFDISVNSCFTGGFTRLNHLAHPDKEQQRYWIEYFKNFIDLSLDLGASYVGSHLGILSYSDNKNRNKILTNRVIKNWHQIGEYAYKKKLKSLIWEPMSISREFGETIQECKKIQFLLNKKQTSNFKLCLDVGHGDINSKNKKNFDPYFWLKSFAKESPVIHIKQVHKGSFGHLPFTKKNNLKGIIDAQKVLNIINNQKNNETELAFELSFKERDPIDKNLKRDVIDSVKYWQKYIN